MYCIFLAKGEHIDLRNRALGDHGSSFSKQLCLAFGKRGEILLFIRWLGFFRGFLPRFPKLFVLWKKYMAILCNPQSVCFFKWHLFMFRFSSFFSKGVAGCFFCSTFPHWGSFALRSCVEIANWCWAVCRRCSFSWDKNENVENDATGRWWFQTFFLCSPLFREDSHFD